MGRIAITEFWTFKIDTGEGMTFKLEETMASDALLLGRSA